MALPQQFSGAPTAQRYWLVLSLWQQRLGAPEIQRIDTRIGVVKGGAAGSR